VRTASISVIQSGKRNKMAELQELAWANRSEPKQRNHSKPVSPTTARIMAPANWRARRILVRSRGDAVTLAVRPVRTIGRFESRPGRSSAPTRGSPDDDLGESDPDGPSGDEAPQLAAHVATFGAPALTAARFYALTEPFVFGDRNAGNRRLRAFLALPDDLQAAFYKSLTADMLGGPA
jgi:hypothetical protein